MEIQNANLNLEAWSDGQIRSKLWLCEKLEKHWSELNIEHRLWIYGSWYGTLAQFLLVRDRIPFYHMGLFELDPIALEISKRMVTSWTFAKKTFFDFYLKDCETITTDEIQSLAPGLIINTSCEHFQNYNWFHRFPRGQHFLFQSTNMINSTHVSREESLQKFKEHLNPIDQIFYEGTMTFSYAETSFDRYMILGRK